MTYEDKAREIAGAMKPEDVVFAPCDCYSLPSHCLMFEPEDFKSFRDVAYYYSLCRLTAQKYWSVHWNGRHVLHIHSPAWFMSWCSVCAGMI